MKNFKLIAVAALSLCSGGVMQATLLTSTSGLSSVGITPIYTLNFDNAPGLTANSVIGNQFAFAGVTFANPAFYDGNNSPNFGGCNNFSNVSTDCVTNYTTNGASVSTPITPFSILFSTPQSYAAFAIVTGANGNNNTTLTAYRNGSVVDFGSITTSTTNPVNFVGFYAENTPFDRITITPSGANLIIIDNLQLSSVPEPGTIGMLALGIGGVFTLARRRRRTA